MFETMRNAWKIKDLRRSILFTLGMLLVYRFAAAIRLPNINFEAAADMASSSLFAMMDLFNGGTLANFTLLATGITPYITASIIMLLLTMATRSKLFLYFFERMAFEFYYYIRLNLIVN